MPPREAPTPPCNLDAEESVLGAMMLVGHAVDACSDVLTGREFYRAAHGKMFEAIVAVHGRNEPVDPITVSAELERHGLLEQVGGREAVHTLAALVPAASNAKHYAHLVRETWLQRGLVLAGMELTRLGYEGTGTIDELFAEADNAVLDLQGYLGRQRDTVFTAAQLIEAYRQKLQHPEEDGVGVKAPFPFMRPLRGSRLYVLGGYQADGKTALALQFLRAACEGGTRVGFASIEMSRADLVDRLISSFGVPYDQVRTGQVIPEYQQRLEQALTEISNWDFEVIDDEELDPAEIRRQQRRGRYGLMIVDHLHRIPIRDKRYERQELEDSVRRFTNIAREFEIPLLLLGQLSRAADKRDPFPRPTTADLKGSGAIEQEAATVWFVWRKRDKQHTPGSEAELITAKDRFGPIGYHHLWFHGRQVRFGLQETEA